MLYLPTAIYTDISPETIDCTKDDVVTLEQNDIPSDPPPESECVPSTYAYAMQEYSILKLRG